MGPGFLCTLSLYPKDTWTSESTRTVITEEQERQRPLTVTTSVETPSVDEEVTTGTVHSETGVGESGEASPGTGRGLSTLDP